MWFFLSWIFCNLSLFQANAEYPRHNLSAASSTLVELTTRLDFFKEKRSELIEQLHNLDVNYGNAASSQDFIFRPPSPSWNVNTASSVYSFMLLLLLHIYAFLVSTIFFPPLVLGFCWSIYKLELVWLGWVELSCVFLFLFWNNCFLFWWQIGYWLFRASCSVWVLIKE